LKRLKTEREREVHQKFQQGHRPSCSLKRGKFNSRNQTHQASGERKRNKELANKHPNDHKRNRMEVLAILEPKSDIIQDQNHQKSYSQEKR
jgi:hypothetical protein